MAVAVLACENTENDDQTNRNVEMMLLVDDRGCLKITAKAWDRETATSRIPEDVSEVSDLTEVAHRAGCPSNAQVRQHDSAIQWLLLRFVSAGSARRCA